MLDGLLCLADIKIVLYHLFIDPWHVLMAPCKDIQVLFQKLYQLVLQNLLKFLSYLGGFG